MRRAFRGVCGGRCDGGREPTEGERFADAVDARLPVHDGAGPLLRKAFPDHWSFLLGEIALYSLVVLLLTGVWLTFFFDPEMREVVYHGPYAPWTAPSCRVPSTRPCASASRCAADC